MRQLRPKNVSGPRTGPAELFISEKTGDGMETEAIGNLVKNAFRRRGIEGSGQRLRAHFATKLAERLWGKAFKDNMFHWDQQIENTVLIEIAQALGHTKPNTTCRHYLDMGRVTYFKLGHKSELKSMRRAVDAMAKHHRRITGDFFDKIARLLELRGACGTGATALDAVLDEILADPDFAPAATPACMDDDPNRSGREPALLRIVPKKVDM